MQAHCNRSRKHHLHVFVLVYITFYYGRGTLSQAFPAFDLKESDRPSVPDLKHIVKVSGLWCRIVQGRCLAMANKVAPSFILRWYGMMLLVHRVKRHSNARCAMRSVRQQSGCGCFAFRKCCCCTSSASSTQAPPERSSPTMSPFPLRSAQLCLLSACTFALSVHWLQLHVSYCVAQKELRLLLFVTI